MNKKKKDKKKSARQGDRVPRKRGKIGSRKANTEPSKGEEKTAVFEKSTNTDYPEAGKSVKIGGFNQGNPSRTLQKGEILTPTTKHQGDQRKRTHETTWGP